MCTKGLCRLRVNRLMLSAIWLCMLPQILARIQHPLSQRSFLGGVIVSGLAIHNNSRDQKFAYFILIEVLYRKHKVYAWKPDFVANFRMLWSFIICLEINDTPNAHMHPCMHSQLIHATHNTLKYCQFVFTQDLQLQLLRFHWLTNSDGLDGSMCFLGQYRC